MLFQTTGYLTLGALGVALPRMGNEFRIAAPANTYQCRDGRILIGVLLDTQWQRLAGLLGRPELAAAPRLRDHGGADREPRGRERPGHRLGARTRRSRSPRRAGRRGRARRGFRPSPRPRVSPPCWRATCSRRPRPPRFRSRGPPPSSRARRCGCAAPRRRWASTTRRSSTSWAFPARSGSACASCACCSQAASGVCEGSGGWAAANGSPFLFSPPGDTRTSEASTGGAAGTRPAALYFASAQPPAAFVEAASPPARSGGERRARRRARPAAAPGAPSPPRAPCDRSRRLLRDPGGGVVANRRRERRDKREAVLDLARGALSVGLEARQAALDEGFATFASRRIDSSRLRAISGSMVLSSSCPHCAAERDRQRRCPITCAASLDHRLADHRVHLARHDRGAGLDRRAAPARRGRSAGPSPAGGCRWRSSSGDAATALSAPLASTAASRDGLRLEVVAGLAETSVPAARSARPRSRRREIGVRVEPGADRGAAERAARAGRGRARLGARDAVLDLRRA